MRHATDTDTIHVFAASCGLAVCTLVMMLVIGAAVLTAAVSQGLPVSGANWPALFTWMLSIVGAVWGASALVLSLMNHAHHTPAHPHAPLLTTTLMH